jgi:hypothetical protein
MADQVSHPPRFSEMHDEVLIAQTQAKMDVLERINERLARQLAAIFDGIGRNEQVELVYPNGEVVLITKARKRGEKEGGE